jgi:hypothetical protein
MSHLLALAAAGCALAAPAAACAAPTPISLQQRPSTVSSHQGVLAWSDYLPASGRYQLVVQQPGQAATPAPIATSLEPFDVDLGSNRSGSPTAVYTRCTTPGRPAPSADSNPGRGTGCDLYRLNLRNGLEEHLTQLSAPKADESSPSVLAGDIAFVRRERGRGGHLYDTLRIGNTTRTGTPTKVLARADVTRRQSLSDVQLGVGRVAYVLSDPGFGFGRETVHVLQRSSGRDRAIYRAQSGGANSARVTRPSWDERTVGLYWARTNDGSGAGNRYVRWSSSTGSLRYALGTSRAASTSWVDDDAGMLVANAFGGTSCLGNVNDPPERSACQIFTTGPLSFDARP